ncbi:hypothetical protein ACFFGV_01900 [Pontibacillus salicampi]|uniref:Uncharacterized protein n=1 Tax=Pontibacillus salicampi TaxID=1449801 RepID=A0ABV6LIW8_9BACI
MLYMNRRRLLEDKIERLLNGQTAYAESQELIRLLKRELDKRNITVLMDQTDSGCWFIPEHRKAN